MDETAERSTVAWYTKQHEWLRQLNTVDKKSLDEKITHTRLLYRYKDINNDQKLQYIKKRIMSNRRQLSSKIQSMQLQNPDCK